jgi:hypothetical protein
MAILVLSCAGCGDDLTPASEVEHLRVFAVSKDPSLARPGEEVTLRMLWHEPRAGRETQIVWVAACWNPEGDLFYRCFDELAAVASALDGGTDPRVGIGDTFRVSVPDDVISSRPPDAESNVPAYGLGYVFFAACAGTLGPAPAASGDDFPVACFDGAGRMLGAEDFIVGYVEIGASEEGGNAAPVLDAVAIDGREVPLDCVGDACVDGSVDEAPITCEGGDPRCVTRCRDDDGECATIEVAPRVSGLELDPIDSALEGDDRWELSWVRFYADGGELDGDLRVVCDPESGPRPAEVELDAQDASGEVRFWVTLHDDRGGATWVRFRLRVVD